MIEPSRHTSDGILLRFFFFFFDISVNPQQELKTEIKPRKYFCKINYLNNDNAGFAKINSENIF